MIKNYFKIAFRGFRKHKLFTLINIIGLSIGISAALVIYLIVHFDFTFNKFNGDSKQIYRVVSNYTFAGEPSYNSGVCDPLTLVIQSEVPGIDKSAPFYTMYETRVLIPVTDNKEVKLKKETGIILADGRYFDIFKYNWLKGSPRTALSTPYQVVLTSESAKKYFPKLSYSEMIGKEIIYEDSVKTTVSGIVESLKQNTDFIFHDFISYSTGLASKQMKDYFQMTNWGSTSSSSQLFIKLNENTSATTVTKSLNRLLKKYDPPKPEDKGSTKLFGLQKLAELHFDQRYGSFDSTRTANRSTLYSLLLIAGFLLLLGCINFINLTTAQASQRAKEIGIRKTMGGKRGQLIAQFMSETFLISLLAMLISVALAPVILKLFADFIPEGVSFNILSQPHIIVFLILITLLVSGMSGFYPALVLSNYKPVTVLKGQLGSNSSKTRNAWLRKSLTVTQFVIAQFFIMATLLVSKQIYYALHKNLGFKKEAILNISTPYKSIGTGKQQVFLNKVFLMPQVQLVSIGGAPPSSGGTNSSTFEFKDGKKEIATEVELKFGDENYAKVYDLKLLAGRNLIRADTAKALIINNTYARVLGFGTPIDAIDKQVIYNGKKMEIIGVAADFFQKSLRSAIKPLAILQPVNNKWNNRTFHIALKPQSAGGAEWKMAITNLEKIWKEIYTEDDFEYGFFDENIKKYYDAEQNTAKLLNWATGLSIFISCLGLLGLAIYTTTLRTKEIGVRKVLGASVSQIVTLLSAELIWLIVLAFVLVTPMAYYAMHKWMENFADHTTISWWIFVLSGAGMLTAALFTLSLQTVKAAIANPVKSLRSE
ncbi:ABC transporter permease [Mucilaginibacter phyllosphaerae]|uniref:ABC transporter permease n=1 Tax=Mucilaginibacter phyllosphaerae TaxID=1812349 RepID=A0A4Y8A717_9SPHI|nr:ABC transporter permease [Mucilaginibacter phyllosphaerae]MBB3970876.1 ABC-type antimicrobial peptide transport system permease subunit [Mucilaginibacter phyllosphaerae]TEW64189.1 ABC transporter permease [Mucilaginibacter phyllosphaerae]GGH05155.1 ABC transporter permease [Mucilaginibacter phyllosphaerae]